MATENPVLQIANPMDPDAFAAGAPDKFVGVIKSALAYPYVGKDKANYYGYVGIRIVPDQESGFEEFTQSYFAMNFTGSNPGWPSKDGKTIAGGNVEQYSALGNGKGNLDDGPCLDDHRHVIPTHPNVGKFVLGRFAKFMSFQQFCDALRDCDTKGKVDRRPETGLDFLVGLKCRFDRVPQSQKEGVVATAKKPEDKDKPEFKTLVPTELVSVGNPVTGGASADASSSSSAAPAGANGAGNLDEAIVTEILAQLQKAGPEGLSVGALGSSVPKAMIVAGTITKKEKGYVMGWVMERDEKSKMPINLVDIDDTTYDPAKDTLTAD